MKRNLYHKLIIAFSVPFFFLFFYYAAKRWHVIKKDRRLTLLIIVTALLYVGIFETVADFGEKLHVLNFSILAILIYKALSPISKIPWALLLASFLSSIVGALDEYFQTFIPGRAGTIHDALIAVRSAVIGVIIAWIFDAYSRKGRPNF